MLDLNNISPQRPLVLSSGQELLQLFRDMLAEVGFTGVPQQQVAQGNTEEIGTEAVRSILARKGYEVKSAKGLYAVLNRHKLTVTKRGKNNLYLTAEIEAIPNLK